MKNAILGALAIIIGLIVMAFPLAGIIVAGKIFGFLLLFIGIWLLIAGVYGLDTSRTVGILNLILGLLALILGLGLVFNPLFLSFIASFLLYLAGIFLIISGLITMLARAEYKYALWSGIVGVILGILYTILGIFALHPIYLGLLIGLWFIINGVFLLFEKEE